MRVVLTREELAKLDVQSPATKSNGGWQGLIVGLQQRVDRNTGELVLGTKDLERIPRYAYDYGQGGWENRLMFILGRSLGPSLGRVWAA
jgi:hypothetical protein